MRVPEEYAMGTIRFSVGRYTTRKEIDDAASQVGEAVRRMSGERLGGVQEVVATEVRLTQFTHGMGCACKIRPQYLEGILKDLPVPTDPDVLVSLATSDDAAVYRISPDTAVIQTVDFFTPIVDDPYQFGAIAAANALSDVYAMGGKPLFALNIVGFPENRLPAQVLKDILRGASDKATEAGIHILGGHTVEDTEPKFGMTVTGIIHPDRIIRNDTPEPGDALVLTKPIGTGLVATAMKRGVADAYSAEAAIRSMAELNDKAAAVMSDFDVHACTDVTGFGLLGHLAEMIRPSSVQVKLDLDSIPLLPGAVQYAADNIVPGGTINNKAFVEPVVEYDQKLSEVQKILVNDAQTSGGLLIALPWDSKDDLLAALMEQGITAAACIGRVGEHGVGKIFIG
jgi:selenium donor protein